MMHRNAILLILIVAASEMCACSCTHQALARYEYSEIVMGTEARIVLYSRSETDARFAARTALDRMISLDGVMSDYHHDSELMRLCRMPQAEPVTVSDDLFRVLHRAQTISEKTGGAFDITIGPLSHLWREAIRNGSKIPYEAIEIAKNRIGWKYVYLDEQSQTVTLSHPFMQLDLGGIGKGFAIDEAITVLKYLGVQHSLVDLGGDIALGESPPGKDGWSVSFPPELNHGDTLTLKLANVAIATSGHTEQFVEIDSVQYSHIIDPATGLGLTNNIIVTVVAPDATTADALASAISVVGLDRVELILQRFPHTSAALITKSPSGEEKVFYSDSFPLTATQFRSKSQSN